jgi:hypothetical protein
VPTTSSPAEGTIRFAYNLTPPDGPTLPAAAFSQLRAWRQICRRLGIIGCDPYRYAGLGFGNLSVRDPADPAQFVITASQTSCSHNLQATDLVRIRAYSLAHFWVDAEGHKPPSSETLTHALIYAADPTICWVLHGHSPELWQTTARLSLPAIPVDVPYGTAAMAEAVAVLAQAHPTRPLVFTTLGHEDGVFACGADAHSTGLALVAQLAEALA